MAKVAEAVEEVRSLARTFQSVISLAEALEGFASVEAAINEGKVRLTKLRKEIEKAQGALATAQSDLAEAVGAAETVRASSEEARAVAERNAAEMVARAQADAERVARAAYDRMDAELAVREAKLALIDESIVARSQELNDIDARIARARAKMAELLGA